MIKADLQNVFNDWGTWCQVQGEHEAEPRPVLMLVMEQGQGAINSRNNILQFVDTATLPRGATFAYGCLWASDAPPGMSDDAKLTVIDSAGKEWSSLAAKAFYGINPATRQKELVAWRLALRGKQRMVRGR